MQRYATWALFALIVTTPVAAQTPDAASRVQGGFAHGADFCKKRCADDAACFKECTQHFLAPDEVRDVITKATAEKVEQVQILPIAIL